MGNYINYKKRTRICKRCDIEKSLNDFPGRRIPYCNECYPLIKRERKTARNIRDKVGRRLEQRMSVQQYEEMLKAQGNTCAICGRDGNKWRLILDHDHITKKPRGFLCISCNVKIGKLENGIIWVLDDFDKFAQYLESYGCILKNKDQYTNSVKNHDNVCDCCHKVSTGLVVDYKDDGSIVGVICPGCRVRLNHIRRPFNEHIKYLLEKDPTAIDDLLSLITDLTENGAGEIGPPHEV